MVKKLFALAILIGISVIFYRLYRSYESPQKLPATSQYYAERGPDELRSANLVTSVVVTYRGLDTLGEVTAAPRRTSRPRAPPASCSTPGPPSSCPSSS